MRARRETLAALGPLRKRADFLRVQAARRKWVTPLLIIQIADMPAGAGSTGLRVRFGLTVTKKMLPNAVDRNRLRRRFRALMRDILGTWDLTGPIDVVLLPRLPAMKATRENLEKDLKWALKRLLSPKENKDAEAQGAP